MADRQDYWLTRLNYITADCQSKLVTLPVLSLKISSKRTSPVRFPLYLCLPRTLDSALLFRTSPLFFLSIKTFTGQQEFPLSVYLQFVVQRFSSIFLIKITQISLVFQTKLSSILFLKLPLSNTKKWSTRLSKQAKEKKGKMGSHQMQAKKANKFASD